ncbi:DUF6602 domain-containing protein [Pseudoflavonifractor phocaeensis]|uniref:DUF6602 domain-containing protein n=1 Tax=Pseudoflavonifractor phocaeensis TaxID=1870988 RepID=UPI001F476F47|nr:DUF6602 domain-containing protein [Pseudoflavonifractor phocaeensis]MCF2661779.1 hypothetical protein [Pseudoflavonifractor phocaeensis]
MSEINLSELYSNMQAEMLQTLRTGAAAFTHPGTKGDNTEVNWINWFAKYLPSRYAVDKAVIIDSTGRCSNQIDLVIYDAQYSYLVFHHQDSKLIWILCRCAVDLLTPILSASCPIGMFSIIPINKAAI